MKTDTDMKDDNATGDDNITRDDNAKKTRTTLEPRLVHTRRAAGR
jgi:hypothetical protein